MVPSQLSQEAVNPDTQAVLLLCGTFAKGDQSDVRPLTLQEYNALALWLLRQGRRPAALLEGPEVLVPSGEPGLPEPARIRALLGRGVQMAAALERWQRLGLWVVSRGEDRYPERLRRNLRSGAPALLYGAGDVTRLDLGGLAIVGSRDADEEALSFTRRVAERCTSAGIQVLSGGARGVDQAAALAAVESGGGAVSVLADRLDRVATSREAKGPIRSGALTLVSPYEPEAGFSVGRAMGRNKHIYALADYALVVRFTTAEGGTWAGAVEQLRLSKPRSVTVPVFVRVAHNPEDGWHQLRSKGALPFPEEELGDGNLSAVLSRAVSASPHLPQPASPDASAGAPSLPDGTVPAPPEASIPSEGTAPSRLELTPREPLSASAPAVPAFHPADTCYHRCLPLLLQHLRKEPGKKELPEIARQLEILPEQVKEWLQRAVEEGKVTYGKSKGRRMVYQDASLGETAGMFDRGGDAA